MALSIEAHRKPDHAKRFPSIKTFATNEGRVMLMDVIPPMHQDRLVIIGGLGHSLHALTPPAQTLAENGYHVQVPLWQGHLLRNWANTEAQNEADSIAQALKMAGVTEPSTIITLSKSSKVGLRLAEAGVVDTLVMINPLGFTDKQANPFLIHSGRYFTSGINRASRLLQNPDMRTRSSLRFSDTVFTYLRDIPGKVKEIGEMVNAPIPERVQKVKENGVKIAVLCAEEDLVFPFNEVKRNAAEAGVDIIKSVPGHHDNFFENTPAVINALKEALGEFNA